MPRLRVGVIGLGFIGNLHARIFAEAANAELVAVSDINKDTAASIGEQFGCRSYTDYAQMIDQEELDAVSICTPDQYHVEQAVYAASQGLDLLIEKPLATSETDARRIADAAQDAGVRLMVAQILHFDPRYIELKQAVRKGELGELIHLFFRRTNPRINAQRVGGAASIFHYIGVHDFEMMCAVADSEPVKAYCQSISKVNAAIGSEDSIFAIITFASGAIAAVELSWALPENSALGINTYAEVAGVKGVTYVDIMNQGVTIIDSQEVRYPDTMHWPEYNGRITGNLQQELNHFIEATLNHEEYVVNTEHAITAVKVIEACRESIRSGEAVSISKN